MTSGVGCLVSGVGCRVSGVGCRVSGVGHYLNSLVSGGSDTGFTGETGRIAQSVLYSSTASMRLALIFCFSWPASSLPLPQFSAVLLNLIRLGYNLRVRLRI